MWKSIVVPMMLVVRRIVFIFMVTVMRDHLLVQLAAQTFMALGMAIFLHGSRPLESKFANNVEIGNEYTTLTLAYFLMCFTDFVPESSTRYDLGAYYIYVKFANIGVHLFIMLFSSVCLSKKSCQRRR